MLGNDLDETRATKLKLLWVDTIVLKNKPIDDEVGYSCNSKIYNKLYSYFGDATLDLKIHRARELVQHLDLHFFINHK